MPFRCVDGDVVVPMSLFPKEEYAARTIRPKLHRHLDEYLVPIPEPEAATSWRGRKIPEGEPIDPDALLDRLRVGGVGEVPGYRGGPAEARRRLDRFLADRLPRYARLRNEASIYATSELSAHLHFGHVSPLTCALAALDGDAGHENVDAYLEELIVRRRARRQLRRPEPGLRPPRRLPRLGPRRPSPTTTKDPRPHRYTAAELEAGETHDPLWNASQKEMVLTGRMHNYTRMYWAKKILEWSPDAEAAFAITVDLNDRYEMDGRDPNGYASICWAIGGRHDRPWPERPIFGKIRFMSYESTRRKFDSAGYVERVRRLEREGPAVAED